MLHRKQRHILSYDLVQILQFPALQRCTQALELMGNRLIFEYVWVGQMAFLRKVGILGRHFACVVLDLARVVLFGGVLTGHLHRIDDVLLCQTYVVVF